MSAHEKPMLFSGPMVRAILDGSKTQTRRIVKNLANNDDDGWEIEDGEVRHSETGTRRDPPYRVGMRLWVRETWQSFGDSSTITPPVPHSCQIRYVADGETRWVSVPQGSRGVYGPSFKKKPSIFMPRWASRITLEITDVRVQRLQDISEEDAMAEGVDWRDYAGLASKTARKLFADLWESTNGKDSWHANPWVWVYEFKRVEGGAE